MKKNHLLKIILETTLILPLAIPIVIIPIIPVLISLAQMIAITPIKICKMLIQLNLKIKKKLIFLNYKMKIQLEESKLLIEKVN